MANFENEASNVYVTGQSVSKAGIIAIWELVNILQNNSGKAFGSPQQAIDFGQENLPASLGPMMTLNSGVMEVRGPGQTGEQLFTSYPNWGILYKFYPGDWEQAVANAVANSGKVFGSKDLAIAAGQENLPPQINVVLVREGNYLEFRGAGSTNDPLFSTYPNWGVLARFPNSVLLDTEISDRQFVDNQTGIIILSNATATVAPDESSTLITAEIPSNLSDKGVAVIGGSSVRLVLPAGLKGALSLQVVGDDERSIMNERNAFQLTAGDVTEGASIVLDRRAGNWIILSGAIGVDKYNFLSTRDYVISRDGIIIPTEISSGSTGDNILLETAPSFLAQGITIPVQTKFTKFEYRPTQTNTASNPTVTMDGLGPFGIRDEDGNPWPAEGFIVGRHYFLHRIGQQVRVMFSGPNSGTGGGSVNANPLNTDAGFKVEDLNGKITFRHDEDGTYLAGVEGSVESHLVKMDVNPIRPTVRSDDLDISAAYELTDESIKAVNKGIMARGGRAAPMPTFCMPQPIDWGKNWLANVQVPITPDSPRIITDPMYQRNVGFDEFVHPHVIHFPHGWMGYEYILCMNPYAGGAPGGSETLENPAIYGSHDMINWEPFTHFQNPLADSTDFTSSRSFLSDNVWFYDPLTSEILCIYRRFNVAIQRMYYEYRATTDGIHWTEPRNIVMYDSAQETVGEWVSPALAYNPEDGLYYMIVGQEYNFYLRTKKNLRDLDEPWSDPIDIQVPGWHGEIRVIGNRLYLFSCNVNHAPGFKIHRSADGDWTSPYELVRENFIDNTEFVAEYGSALTYKNTLVPHLYNDGTAQVKCIIQCRPNSSTWWLFYGETPRQPIVDA